MGLALMMTWFLMQPVLTAGGPAGDDAVPAGDRSRARRRSSGDGAGEDLHAALCAGERPGAVCLGGHDDAAEAKEDLPMQVVVPAYMLSELKAGFQIGAVLFLPFLLVDLVVASVTTSIGMLQLPPVVISTPVKILLFVMVDGWNLLADCSLLKSF
jgi:flagellar biosynthetic protein FliP